MREVVFLVICICIGEVCGDKLAYVISINRNGAAKEDGNHNFNITTDDDWNNQSYGFLEPAGRRQAYLSGRELRQRYISNIAFLNTSFYNYQLKIYSHSSNSTIESAYALLTGLFPIGTGETLTDDQLASNRSRPPINVTNLASIEASLELGALPNFLTANPTHTKLMNETAFNALEYCPAISYLEKNVTSDNDDVEEDNEKYQAMYEYIQSNFSLTEELNLTEAQLFYNDFLAANLAGKTLKVDLNETIREELKNAYFDRFNASLFGNEKAVKIMNTGLLLDIITSFNNSVENQSKITTDDQAPKFDIYMLKDSNIAALLKAYGLEESIYNISFSCILNLELYLNETASKGGVDNNTNYFYIKAYLNYNSVSLNGNETYNLTEFIQDMYTNKIYADSEKFNTECFNTGDDKIVASTTWIIVVVVVVVIVVLIIIGSVVFYVKKNRKRNSESHVANNERAHLAQDSDDDESEEEKED